MHKYLQLERALSPLSHTVKYKSRYLGLYVQLQVCILSILCWVPMTHQQNMIERMPNSYKKNATLGKSTADGRVLANEKNTRFFYTHSGFFFLGNARVEGMLHTNLHHESVMLLPVNSLSQEIGAL